MKKAICGILCPFILLLLSFSLHHPQAQTQQEIKVSEPLTYARIYTDAEGESHFSDEKLMFQLIDYAPPAPPISVTEALAAENITFISSPAGWYGDFHPAPRRQFVIVLVGEMVVEVSDGEKRKFDPGKIILVEDTWGKGHRSIISSNIRATAVAIPLREKVK
jgi:hypothetical protein